MHPQDRSGEEVRPPWHGNPPLSPVMAEHLLARRRDSYRGPTAPVFASKAGTELLPANVYRRILAPAAIGLGLTVEYEAKDK